MRHTPIRGLGALGTLIAFILFLIFLGILWVATGGPDRPISHAGPFLKPPRAPGVQLKNGEVQGAQFEAEDTQLGSVRLIEDRSLVDRFFSNSKPSSSSAADSPYAQSIELTTAKARNGDPNTEYILIKTSRDLPNSITISDWILESGSSAIKQKIGPAAQIPLLGGINSETPVTVGANSYIYITTGSSPIGSSFRTNICTGYFEQRQDFEPKLERECPSPEEEALKRPEKTASNVACIDFVENLSSCELYSREIPYEIGSQCRDFVLNDLSYSGCVALNREDPKFYKPEWRLYLNRQQELWNNTHEQIRLYDEAGKLVSSVTY